MPQRLGLRAWLEQEIDSGKYKGVHWTDKSKGQFVVPWKHASRHGWQNEDAALFKAWAVYTRRFQEERGDDPSPKTWKANFRCAVNALPDIKSVKDRNKKGKNACRVFEFSKKRKSRETVCQRQVPVKLNEVKTEKTSNKKQTDYDEPNTKYNTRRKIKVESDYIKREPEEEISCMVQEKIKRRSIKQEFKPKNEEEHCYQSKPFEPHNFGPCFKDIINMSNLPMLPNGRELNHGQWFQNHLQTNYATYGNCRQFSPYNTEANTCVPEPFYQTGHLPDLKTVLEVAECMLNDVNDASSGSEYMCDERSDGEELMESCRPGSVGSAALSDAELEELFMPKEETIETDYEFEDGSSSDYIYSDPFLNEKGPRGDDMLQIKAITQALINSSELH